MHCRSGLRQRTGMTLELNILDGDIEKYNNDREKQYRSLNARGRISEVVRPCYNPPPSTSRDSKSEGGGSEGSDMYYIAVTGLGACFPT